MPKRRRRGRGGRAVAAGLGEGLGSVSDVLLRQYSQDQTQNKMLDRQLQLQGAAAENASIDDILKAVSGLGDKPLSPDQGAALMALKRPGLDRAGTARQLRTVQPSAAVREGPARRAMQAAKTPEELTGIEANLPSMFREADLPTDPVFPAGQFGQRAATAPPGSGMLPSAQYGPEAPPQLQKAITDLRAMRTSLEQAPGTLQPIPGAVNAEGTAGTQFVNPRDMMSGAAPRFVPTERTGTQNAQRTIQEAQTGLEGGLPEMQGQAAGRQESAKLSAGPSPDLLGQRKGQEELASMKMTGRAKVDQAFQEALAKKTAEIQAEGARKGLSNEQTQFVTGQAAQYFTQAKPFLVRQSRFRELVELAKQPGPVAGTNMLRALSKFMLPEESVMSEDYKTNLTMGGLPERLVDNFTSNMLGKTDVSPQMRQQILKTASTVFQGSLKDHALVKDGFIKRAAAVKVNPNLIVSEPDPALIRQADQINAPGQGQAAPPAPPGWQYVPKPGGGWTAIAAPQ